MKILTYIDYLNDFNRWLEEDNPTNNVIVLYYALLNMFNRRGWPRWAGVDTRRLMDMVRTTSNNTAYRARDTLVEAGFIKYKPGRKGKCSEYCLLDRYRAILTIESSTENGTESSTENGTESSTENGTENGTPNKTKTKKKTKTFPQEPNGSFGNITTSSSGARAQSIIPTNLAIAEVVSDFMDRINAMAPASCLQELATYATTLGPEVCKRAFDIALAEKKTTWSYIRAILRNCTAKGIKCIADWDDAENDREQRKAPSEAKKEEMAATRTARNIAVLKRMSIGDED